VKIGIYLRSSDRLEDWRLAEVLAGYLDAKLYLVPKTRGGTNSKRNLQAFTNCCVRHSSRRFDGIILISEIIKLEYDAVRLISATRKTWERSAFAAFSFRGIKIGVPLDNGIFDLKAATGIGAVFIGTSKLDSSRKVNQHLKCNEELDCWELEEEVGSRIEKLALFEPVVHTASIGLTGPTIETENSSSDALPFRTQEGWLKRSSNAPIPSWRDGGKVAFLFLTRNGMLNKPIWDYYLNENPQLRSIYLHCGNRNNLAEWEQRNALNNPIDTKWGCVSLVSATLELIRAAVADPMNRAFVLCSESCLPIVPLRHVHQRCLRSGKAYLALESQDEVAKRHRRHLGRNDNSVFIPDKFVHFHPQWIVLNRRLAEFFVANDLTDHFKKCFAPDETYFGTMAALVGLLDEVVKVHTTWSQWTPKSLAHPTTFDAVPRASIFEAVSRGCLFARKFSELGKEDQDFMITQIKD
jgi:hypothetical protein